MALLKCSDCGRDVSDAATACPGCGRPTPSQIEATRTVAKIARESAAHDASFGVLKASVGILGGIGLLMIAGGASIDAIIAVGVIGFIVALCVARSLGDNIKSLEKPRPSIGQTKISSKLGLLILLVVFGLPLAVGLVFALLEGDPPPPPGWAEWRESQNVPTP